MAGRRQDQCGSARAAHLVLDGVAQDVFKELLAEHLAGLAHDRHVGNIRVPGEGLLGLHRVDVAPAGPVPQGVRVASGLFR